MPAGPVDEESGTSRQLEKVWLLGPDASADAPAANEWTRAPSFQRRVIDDRRCVMSVAYDQCIDTTTRCIAAAERCVAICGTSGDAERERCAALGRDCADVGRLVEALMLRGSPYASDACGLHAVTCDAFADYCAKWPKERCCNEAMIAARACAKACRSCATREAA